MYQYDLEKHHNEAMAQQRENFITQQYFDALHQKGVPLPDEELEVFHDCLRRFDGLTYTTIYPTLLPNIAISTYAITNGDDCDMIKASPHISAFIKAMFGITNRSDSLNVANLHAAVFGYYAPSFLEFNKTGALVRFQVMEITHRSMPFSKYEKHGNAPESRRLIRIGVDNITLCPVNQMNAMALNYQEAIENILLSDIL